jgi:hypothetical protein
MDKIDQNRLENIPDAPVRLIPPERPKSKFDGFTWEVIKCPFCGKKHQHGAGGDINEVDSFLGHRISHCFDDSLAGSYNLVRADQEAKR